MNETTEYLIRGCRNGKHSSQQLLYRKYARKLYVTCLRIVGSTVEAEEAMQDSFLKIFNRLDQYNDSLNFEAWIHRIAVHTAIDYVRRQEPEWVDLSLNLMIPGEEEPDEDEIEYSVNQIKEAMTKLPSGYRVILSLYLFEGYDMEEISSILNIKPATVRSQYMRAKRKLIEIISKN
ncbi:MAG: sigma-70 family RNA polymerase sigma factor [Tannerellaceae bacterium]|nr:sigma-70 family RNA polymerase sigma factor [Tannerellaceae bacterium]